MDWVGRLWRAREGSVIVMGALSLVSVIGMSGLAVEMGNAYAVKVQRQRVADVAALAAALAYKTMQTEAALKASARDVAQANGLKRADADATLSADKSKVTVTVTSAVPLVLTRVLGAATSVALTNTAVASLTTTTTTTTGCLMALSSSGTYGVTLDQGPTTNATGCTVATNSGVSAYGGPRLNAAQVIAGKTIYANGITTSPTPGNIRQNQGTFAIDPLANDSGLADAFARLAAMPTSQPKPFTVTAPAAITAPTVPTGTDWKLDGSTAPPAGVTKAGNAYSVAAGGTYAIKSLTVGAGLTLTFQGASTVTISNGIAGVGNGIAFGNCTCRINGAVDNQYQPLSFGNGSFQFGGPVTLSAGTVSIGNGPLSVAGTLTVNGAVTIGIGSHSVAALSVPYGTLTFGAGDFTVAGPLALGSGTVNVGSGTTWIGASAAGVGLTLSGGARLALGNGDLKVAGSVEVSGGGTTLQMGTGSVTIGRSAAGIGFSDTNGTVTTGGGTYFSVLGPMSVAGDGSNVTLGAADYRIGNNGSAACASLPNAACASLTFTGTTLTFGAGSFSVNGNFMMTNNGTLKLGAAGTHYIDGTMNVSGGGTLGAGLYLINGDFIRPSTSSDTISGSGVTMVLKGLWSNDGGSSLSLAAPATNGGGGLAGILLATRSAGTMTIANGTHALGGVMYAPKADLRLVNTNINVGGSCLSWIVNTYYQGTGGTANMSACGAIAGGMTTTGSIALVQ